MKLQRNQILVDRKRGDWIEANIPKDGSGASGRPAKNPAKNGRIIPTLKDAAIGHNERLDNRPRWVYLGPINNREGDDEG